VEFDKTRARLQPGVKKLADRIIDGKQVLDLGCGNGALVVSMRKKGFTGAYTGLDFSPVLAQLAVEGAREDPGTAFIIRDLAAPGWAGSLAGPYDRILAFAVIHHLPPLVAEEVLRICRGLIDPEGCLLLSTWQFLRSPRWTQRIQPWQRGGLDPNVVGEDDYLLDWRRGGTGLRYVHYYDEEDLAELAGKCGFGVVETSRSDGKEGDLGLYQVWEPVDA
jgi:SAM-dependent methyltransferase